MMFNKINQLLITVFVVVIIWGCSSGQDQQQAYIHGNVTVADSIDSSTDFSGIGFTIIHRDSADAPVDTLFHAMTDSNGTFSGVAKFHEKGRYPLLISRNEQTLAQEGIILADEDSVFITGQLPDIRETITFDSKEHNALEKYQRLAQNFQRVVQYIRAGNLSSDSLKQELLKWSDLYWSVYQEDQGTIASELSARESIQILQGVDEQKMMKRIRQVQKEDALSDLGATYGKEYIAHSQGLNPTLAYLDSLANMTEDKNKLMRINMQQIKLLYDSARVNLAKEKLKAFQKQYADDKASKAWAEAISYDLNYLSPGDSIPDFQFRQNGKIISRDSLLGTPYVLEITRLANNLYQNQFDRSVVIHGIYKNYGLQFITIPLDQSQVTINAFFEERAKAWPVAGAAAFDRQKLIEKFNIRLIPTRFLIDRKGNIVRKYVGNEYQDVIQGIQKIINNGKEDEEPTS